MMSSTTNLTKENQVAPSEDTSHDRSVMTSDVAYRPVTMDTAQFEVENSSQKESSFCGKHRATISLVAAVVIVIAVIAIIAVVVVTLAIVKRNDDGWNFVYQIEPVNVTAKLYLKSYPNNLTIGEDMVDVIDDLYRGSVFAKVYNETIPMGISRDEVDPEVNLLMVFADLGDHLGSPTGDSELPTDVLDLFLDTCRDNTFKGFDVSNWIVTT